MKLEKGKVYKCWNEDGSYALLFSDGKLFYHTNDLKRGIWESRQFTKVEPYEPEAVDTLQEVVDWCKENEKEVKVDVDGLSINNAFGGFTLYTITDLLTHIRQEPKELTELKALAEKLGYNLSKKD